LGVMTTKPGVGRDCAIITIRVIGFGAATWYCLYDADDPGLVASLSRGAAQYHPDLSS